MTAQGLYIIAAWFCLVGSIAAAVIWLINSDKQLNQFRANLRPGDYCRAKLPGGKMVRVQIIRRNSQLSVVARDVDTYTTWIIKTAQIFRP